MALSPIPTVKNDEDRLQAVKSLTVHDRRNKNEKNATILFQRIIKNCRQVNNFERNIAIELFSLATNPWNCSFVPDGYETTMDSIFITWFEWYSTSSLRQWLTNSYYSIDPWRIEST